MAPPPPGADVRTTHPWLRLPAILLVAAWAVLFASAFVETKDDAPSTWLRRHWGLHWFAGWSMFTNRNRTQVAVDVDVRWADADEDAWERIDISRWFPARWESGLRLDRRSFRGNTARMRTLGAALCGRMDADPQVDQPMAVRFTEVKWRKSLGTARQKRKRRVESREILQWTCGDTPPKPPQGRRL